MVEPSPLLLRLGEAVRSRRQRAGWPRRELARRSSMSERFLADVEHGRANPSVLSLEGIARALGTTAAELITEPPAPAGLRGQTLALLGLRGAGKSTVGHALAERLGRSFVELDARVQETVGSELSEIFEMHGEDYYRRAEREALHAALSHPDPCVLATGGGLVTQPETFRLLRARSRTIWLHAEPEDHWRRVVEQGDTRPMDGDQRAFDHLCTILSEREPLYREADITIETSGRDVDEVVDQVVEALV